MTSRDDYLSRLQTRVDDLIVEMTEIQNKINIIGFNDKPKEEKRNFTFKDLNALIEHMAGDIKRPLSNDQLKIYTKFHNMLINNTYLPKAMIDLFEEIKDDKELALAYMKNSPALRVYMPLDGSMDLKQDEKGDVYAKTPIEDVFLEVVFAVMTNQDVKYLQDFFAKEDD